MTALVVEDRDGVRTVLLNRPDQSNALDEELLDLLDEATLNAERDGDVAAVVVGGEGPNFCAGGDLGMLRRWHALAPGERARRFRCAQQIVRRLVELPVPVIAAVHGAAVGAGLELALAADFCIAETDSSFRSGFVAVGLVPDFGGSWLLPRSIGAARAREMILANTRLDAATALAWGLLHRVVATGDAVASSGARAHQFHRLPRAAPAAAKRATHAAWDTTLADALDRSAYDQSRLMDDPEHRALVGG